MAKVTQNIQLTLNWYEMWGEVKVKAITLIQPWATLIAQGEKWIETRSWATSHRGKLAIHAGKKIDYEACKQPEIKKALIEHGYDDPRELPTSSVIAICVMGDCIKMVESTDSVFKAKVPGYTFTEKEQAFGDYAPGRYAWMLASTKAITPVTAKGALRLWNWDGDIK